MLQGVPRQPGLYLRLLLQQPVDPRWLSHQLLLLRFLPCSLGGPSSHTKTMVLPRRWPLEVALFGWRRDFQQSEMEQFLFSSAH